MDQGTDGFDGFEGRDDLQHRLHALGTEPVDEGLAHRVLARVHRPAASRWRSTKLKVAAAAAGGFLVGSMGLASAGSLPAPAQDAAHSALGAVGIKVPPGTQRYNDPTACPGGPYRNHGDYVRKHPNDPNAASSPCGKPTKSLNHPDDGKGEAPEAPDAPDADGNGTGHGPPPWAHGNKHKGNGNNGNGNGDDEGNGSATPNQGATPTTAAPAPAPAPTTTTTARPAPTTTTTAPPATTTTTVAPTTTTAPPTTGGAQPTTTTTGS